MAKVKVTVNHPNLDKSVEIEVPGVGVVKNGGSIEVDPDDYELVTGNKLSEAFENDAIVTVGSKSSGG